jgi:hypothetical protein|tara:strand:- start:333 stop:482 length:150 start_codon:yes stop_codon:yes gene_type:complete
MNEILKALYERRDDLRNLPDTRETTIKRQENLTSITIALELNTERINKL